MSNPPPRSEFRGAAVTRAFQALPWGDMHLRQAAGPAAGGAAPPLLLLHGGPGSSAGLLPLLQAAAGSRPVLTPDLPGLGDSAPLAEAEPEIADYADAMVSLLDARGLVQVDVYGQHTGAQIGLELALRQPERVRRIVLDGLALFAEEEKTELLARYAPPVVPDGHGGHLAWAWAFVRELSLHFPHYLQDPGHRLLARAVPPPQALQALVVDLLKALPSYHLSYRAAFAHATASRLRLLRHPTLLMATAGDPLARYLAAAAALLGQGDAACVGAAARAATVLGFLAAAGPSAAAVPT
jgi:pimeloyl-ACP methyl ester carboxylesterase